MDNELITTFKKYKESYPVRLEKHKAKYEDYDELHFISIELEYYNNCFETANVYERQILVNKENSVVLQYKYLNDIEALQSDEKTEKYNVKKLIQDDSKRKTDGYNLEICEQLKISFTKIIEFLNELRHYKTIEDIKSSSILSMNIKKESEFLNKIEDIDTLKMQNKLKWHGTPLQFTELVQALILAEIIGVGQDKKEVFDKLRDFFRIDTFDHSDKIRDIKDRKKDHTKFINLLETNINNWIDSED